MLVLTKPQLRGSLSAYAGFGRRIHGDVLLLGLIGKKPFRCKRLNYATAKLLCLAFFSISTTNGALLRFVAIQVKVRSRYPT